MSIISDLWEFLYKCVGIGLLSSLFYLPLRYINSSVADVLGDGGTEQNRFLADHTNLLAQPGQVHLLDVNVVHTHLSGKKFIQMTYK